MRNTVRQVRKFERFDIEGGIEKFPLGTTMIEWSKINSGLPFLDVLRKSYHDSVSFTI